METVKDPEYGMMVETYQLLEIARLNRTLKEHGIADQGVRARICLYYFSGSGLFLDQDGDPFTWQGTVLHTSLCFVERNLSEKGTHYTTIRTLRVGDHANLY